VHLLVCDKLVKFMVQLAWPRHKHRFTLKLTWPLVLKNHLPRRLDLIVCGQWIEWNPSSLLVEPIFNAPVACGSVGILQYRLIPVMLNEAKSSRPELWGQGQFLEAEAKNNYEQESCAIAKMTARCALYK